MFRREQDVRDSTVGNMKTLWSPELKKKQGTKKESVAKTSMVKDKMSVIKDKNQ
ncbi:ERC protein 2-like, partial [Clarias magur]